MPTPETILSRDQVKYHIPALFKQGGTFFDLLYSAVDIQKINDPKALLSLKARYCRGSHSVLELNLKHTRTPKKKGEWELAIQLKDENLEQEGKKDDERWWRVPDLSFVYKGRQGKPAESLEIRQTAVEVNKGTWPERRIKFDYVKGTFVIGVGENEIFNTRLSKINYLNTQDQIETSQRDHKERDGKGIFFRIEYNEYTNAVGFNIVGISDPGRDQARKSSDETFFVVPARVEAELK